MSAQMRHCSTLRARYSPISFSLSFSIEFRASFLIRRKTKQQPLYKKMSISTQIFSGINGQLFAGSVMQFESK